MGKKSIAPNHTNARDLLEIPSLRAVGAATHAFLQRPVPLADEEARSIIHELSLLFLRAEEALHARDDHVLQLLCELLHAALMHSQELTEEAALLILEDRDLQGRWEQIVFQSIPVHRLTQPYGSVTASRSHQAEEVEDTKPPAASSSHERVTIASRLFQPLSLSLLVVLEALCEVQAAKDYLGLRFMDFLLNLLEQATLANMESFDGEYFELARSVMMCLVTLVRSSKENKERPKERWRVVGEVMLQSNDPFLKLQCVELLFRITRNVPVAKSILTLYLSDVLPARVAQRIQGMPSDSKLTAAMVQLVFEELLPCLQVLTTSASTSSASPTGKSSKNTKKKTSSSQMSGGGNTQLESQIAAALEQHNQQQQQQQQTKNSRKPKIELTSAAAAADAMVAFPLIRVVAGTEELPVLPPSQLLQPTTTSATTSNSKKKAPDANQNNNKGNLSDGVASHPASETCWVFFTRHFFVILLPGAHADNITIPYKSFRSVRIQKDGSVVFRLASIPKTLSHLLQLPSLQVFAPPSAAAAGSSTVKPDENVGVPGGGGGGPTTQDCCVVSFRSIEELLRFKECHQLQQWMKDDLAREHSGKSSSLVKRLEEFRVRDPEQDDGEVERGGEEATDISPAPVVAVGAKRSRSATGIVTQRDEETSAGALLRKKSMPQAPPERELFPESSAAVASSASRARSGRSTGPPPSRPRQNDAAIDFEQLLSLIDSDRHPHPSPPTGFEDVLLQRLLQLYSTEAQEKQRQEVRDALVGLVAEVQQHVNQSRATRQGTLGKLQQDTADSVGAIRVATEDTSTKIQTVTQSLNQSFVAFKQDMSYVKERLAWIDVERIQVSEELAEAEFQFVKEVKHRVDRQVADMEPEVMGEVMKGRGAATAVQPLASILKKKGR